MSKGFTSIIILLGIVFVILIGGVVVYQKVFAPPIPQTSPTQVLQYEPGLINLYFSAAAKKDTSEETEKFIESLIKKAGYAFTGTYQTVAHHYYNTGYYYYPREINESILERVKTDTLFLSAEAQYSSIYKDKIAAYNINLKRDITAKEYLDFVDRNQININSTARSVLEEDKNLSAYVIWMKVPGGQEGTVIEHLKQLYPQYIFEAGRPARTTIIPTPGR